MVAYWPMTQDVLERTRPADFVWLICQQLDIGYGEDYGEVKPREFVDRAYRNRPEAEARAELLNQRAALNEKLHDGSVLRYQVVAFSLQGEEPRPS